jgi:hypothetical protein
MGRIRLAFIKFPVTSSVGFFCRSRYEQELGNRNELLRDTNER